MSNESEARDPWQVSRWPWFNVVEMPRPPHEDAITEGKHQEMHNQQRKRRAKKLYGRRYYTPIALESNASRAKTLVEFEVVAYHIIYHESRTSTRPRDHK